MAELRIVRSIRGKWVVCDWMALSEHETEAKAKEALARYEKNRERKPS